MSAPRIAPLESPYPAPVQAALDRIMPEGVPPLALFRTLARNERVFLRLMAGGLLDRGSISLREREIVIDRTCARCGCEYEWGVHVMTFAGRAGLTPPQLTSLVYGGPKDQCWPSEQERLLILAVDALHENADVDDGLWARLASAFGERQLLDLLLLCGWYHAVSFAARAARVPYEPGAPRFTDVLPGP